WCANPRYSAPRLSSRISSRLDRCGGRSGGFNVHHAPYVEFAFRRVLHRSVYFYCGAVGPCRCRRDCVSNSSALCHANLSCRSPPALDEQILTDMAASYDFVQFDVFTQTPLNLLIIRDSCSSAIAHESRGSSQT